MDFVDESIHFFKAFIKNPLHVGAISPSSPELAREMIKGIFPSEKNAVLEIGVGTGAITRFLAPKLPNNRSYLGIEIDREFVKVLHKRFPHLLIVQGDARRASEIARKVRIEDITYIISSLPFASLPREVRREILGEIDKFMQRGCIFRTFQYAHCYYLSSAVEFRKFMDSRYGKAKRSKLILKNLPPAYILTWQTK
ncbi:MAG: methyltransferase domain-containing protein [Acidobacteria bacterium]|jgi:phospholipid N-methyltransferase|nr:MAG: methyltransferase domain-containing protein [Acidobacteriota bacterium]GIU82009.1 MAG: methyltransferase [Pyrinomonadaceae bacterium]